MAHLRLKVAANEEYVRLSTFMERSAVVAYFTPFTFEAPRVEILLCVLGADKIA